MFTILENRILTNIPPLVSVNMMVDWGEYETRVLVNNLEGLMEKPICGTYILELPNLNQTSFLLLALLFNMIIVLFISNLQ